MPVPGPAALQNNGAMFAPGSFQFPIAEVLEDPGLSNIHLSCEGGRSTWPWMINWGDMKSLLSSLQGIIGYSYTAGGKLRRKLPMKHPIFPNMWAKEISGWKPKGYVVKGAATAGNVALWTRLELTVAYWVPPFVVGSDGFVDQAGGSESLRFLEKRPKAATRMLNSDKKEIVFYNVPATYDRTINLGVPRQQMEGLIEYIWYWVPDKYVMGTLGYPSNIYGAVGKVNSDIFLGHNPGTLLIETPDLKEYGQPIGSNAGGDVQLGAVDGLGAPLMYNVTIPVKKLDLDLGVNPNTGAVRAVQPPDPLKRKSLPTGNIRYQGHNVRIHPSDPNGLAYPIQTAKGSAPIYQGTTFANIFKQAP